MNREKITDMDIQALVDGELDEGQRDRILKILHLYPDLYKRYILYKEQKSLLKAWWKDN